MSHRNIDYGPPPNARSSNSFNLGGLKNDRHHDERASLSGSEDGSYALYADAPKFEAELEDDSNAALTSQTLNADGTPKRPMNAFMIFARRRRPQVSAENQAMRTGEISKILSKEWVSMPASEKQFYLEQAKQLKENFNTRYPDYVYRRRPNNSRKRRRSDAGTMRPVDPALLADQGDELVANVDFEASPTEAEEFVEASIPLTASLSRPYSIPPTPLDQAKYGSGLSRAPSHQISPEHMFRSNGHHDPRMPYVTSGSSDRVGSSLGSTASPRNSIHGLHYSYGQSSTHSQSPSIFGTAESPVTGHPGGWQGRVDRPTPPWLGGGQDRMTASIASQKQPPYSPTGSWSSSAENSNTRSNASPSSPNFFPTLNTPFYPNQPQASPFQSHISTSSSHPIPAQPSPFEPLNMQPTSMPRDFASRAYDTSISPENAYTPPPGRDALSYSQRTLPPVQTGSVYHQSSSSSSPAPGSIGYWTRD